MSALSTRIAEFLGVPLAEIRDVGRQHGCLHLSGTLTDGRSIFAKVASSPDASLAGAFAAEANGLRWLAEATQAGGPPLPEVLGIGEEFLVIQLLTDPRQPTLETARRFGEDLARMHAAGADAFGAPWPGFIASLPLDNTLVPAEKAGANWGSWYAERRLVPYLRRAQDDDALSGADVRLVQTVVDRIGELAGPPEPPSRIHGDLWHGNMLWSDNRCWLIDPAAHGGHRETDLAMLALFGAQHLAEILAGYTQTAPLPAGWQARVPLHQLHPLLVHVCLFGPGYRARLVAAARAALAQAEGHQGLPG